VAEKVTVSLVSHWTRVMNSEVCPPTGSALDSQCLEDVHSA